MGYGMYVGCDRYTKSKARTNKLWCSDCESKIKIGESVVFHLSNETGKDKMLEVFCNQCSENYNGNVADDTRHPFDIEGDC